MGRVGRRASVLLGTVALGALAAGLAARAQDVIELDEVVVSGAEETSGTPAWVSEQVGPPPPPFAGGQVATGARLGVLGNRSIFDTPFSQTSYTGEFIENQQARTVTDALAADPSIRPTSQGDSAGTGFLVRGFELDSSDIAIDGLYGLSPIRRTSSLAPYDRLEFLRGPSALVYGIGPFGRIGGTLNLVPKIAGPEPTTEISANYRTEAQFGTALDVGRRFGPEGAFGARVNLDVRDGTLSATVPTDGTELHGTAAAMLDYNGDTTRARLFVYHERTEMDASSGTFGLLPGVELPEAPSGRINQFQPWSYFEGHSTGVIAAVEQDLIPDQLTATVKAGYGRRYIEELATGIAGNIIDEEGNLGATTGYWLPFESDNYSAQAGLTAEITTGPIDHTITLMGSGLSEVARFRFASVGDILPSNLYDPIISPRPDTSDLPRDLRTGREQDLWGVTLADSLSMFDDRVEVIVGGRYQWIARRSYDTDTGVRTAKYDDSAVSPMVAVVVKPIESVSLYASYAEGLTVGPTAPNNAANAGEVFAPSVTTQMEAGVKWDGGTVGVTAAVFELTRPSGTLDPASNIYSVDGEQRSRGAEVTVFGEPVDGVRLTGGVAYVDAVLTGTEGGVNDGNTAPGVSKWYANLSAEVDVPWVPGLTFTGLGVYTGPAPVDASNFATVPEWWRLDLGARYEIDVAGGTLEARALVRNVTDEEYWTASNYSVLSVGEARTFLFTVTRSF